MEQPLLEVAVKWLLGVAIRDINIQLVFVALVNGTFGTIYHKCNLLNVLEVICQYLV